MDFEKILAKYEMKNATELYDYITWLEENLGDYMRLQNYVEELHNKMKALY